MANVAISGDTSGAVTLTVPATAGTQTVTFPAATGTAMVSGNMPAFFANLSASNQSISASTSTKIAFDAVIFDTNNNFSIANNRFTPTVAGYYQFSGGAYYASSGVGAYIMRIYKNGSEYIRGSQIGGGTGASTQPNISCLLYANGTTDYFELWTSQSTVASINIQANNTTPYLTFFMGALVRTA